MAVGGPGTVGATDRDGAGRDDLGDRHSFGLHETSHYVAPVVAWNLPSSWTLRLSPGFGLNDNSHRFLLRWGVSHEFSGFGAAISRLFGGRQ